MESDKEKSLIFDLPSSAPSTQGSGKPQLSAKREVLPLFLKQRKKRQEE